MDKIEPCAICGSTRHDTGKNSAQEQWVNCVECGVTLRLATWQRLSRAARLLAAVEGLAADSVELVYPHHVIEVDCHYGLVNRWLIYTEQLATSERTRSEVSYETLADALIALAEKTNG